MKELDKLIENTFGAKENAVQPFDLVAMVESVLDRYHESTFSPKASHTVLGEQEGTKFEKGREFVLSLPKFAPNENWGDPNSADRQAVSRIFDAIGGGATLEAKLAFLERITDPTARITGTRRIISSLILLESLSSILTSFQAAPAGFVFESFLAALLRGHQIPATGANTIADLEAFSQLGGSANLPISLKLLNPNTKIEGSYTDLVNSLNNDKSMTYVVARKDGKQLNIEAFVFTQENFINAITVLAKNDRMSVRKNLFKLPKLSPERSIKMIQSMDSWEEQYELLRQTAGFRIPKAEREATQSVESPPEEEEGELAQAAESLQLNESRTQWTLDGDMLDKLAAQNAMERTDLGTLPYDPELIYEIAERRMKYLNDNLLELFSSTKSLSDNVNLYVSEEKRANAINHGKEAVKDTSKVAQSLRSELEDDKK